MHTLRQKMLILVLVVLMIVSVLPTTAMAEALDNGQALATEQLQQGEETGGEPDTAGSETQAPGSTAPEIPGDSEDLSNQDGQEPGAVDPDGNAGPEQDKTEDGGQGEEDSVLPGAPAGSPSADEPAAGGPDEDDPDAEVTEGDGQEGEVPPASHPPISMGPPPQAGGEDYAFSKLGFWIGDEYYPLIEDTEDEIMPMSLLPLKEGGKLTYDKPDLRAYLPSQLKNVKLEFAWPADAPEEHNIVWSKDGDKFQALAADGTMDLSPESFYSTTLTLTLIVGKNPGDQTDPNNVKYTVDIALPSIGDLFTFKVFNADGTEKSVARTYFYDSQRSSGSYEYGVVLSKDESLTGETTVQIALNESNRLGAKLKLNKLSCGDNVLTNGELKQDFSLYSYLLTAEVEKDGVTETFDFSLNMSIDGNSYSSYIDGFYESGDADAKPVAKYHNYADGVETYTVDRDHSPDGSYYCRMEVSSLSGMGSSAGVKRAVLGKYYSPKDVEAQPDIKEQLFGGGYQANYSKPVSFTILYDDERITFETVQLLPYVKSSDTSFRIYQVDMDTEEGKTLCSTRIIQDTKNDGMGNIFLTVYILYNNKPIKEGSTLYPYFYVDNGSTVFLSEESEGEATESGKVQKSGESPITFKPGVAYHYSVAAENENDAMNYYVTFVTPSEEGVAKLHVPGDNVQDSNYDKEEKLPVREIHLGDLEYIELYNGNNINYDVTDIYYDILVTNVGDANLTGLSVKLENAENVQLDPYWTILADGTKTLAPFTGSAYSNLANQAKIRLLPLYDDEGNIIHGTISGYLVISSDNGGTVKIKLTGVAGIPKIITETLVPGVKYVPYDSLIQTNNVGASDAVRLELTWDSGAANAGLPNGVNWHPNGELYGVPLVDGSFTFTASLFINNEQGRLLDSKTYTLDIAINQDDNVWGASDPSYSVEDNVGVLSAPAGGVLDGTAHYIKSDYLQEVFRSEGEYDLFVDFFLDGQKLTEGTDYSSTSGSTVITIFEQTFRRAGTGTHTIAAEFHESGENGLPNGTLKRTAQNYTISGLATPSPSIAPSASPTQNTQQNANTRNDIDLVVHVVDGDDKPLAGFGLELRSTPKYATTDRDGAATYRYVAFGSHTLTVNGKDGIEGASKAFKLSSGTGTKLDGDTVTAKPGSAVELTVRLSGGTLVLLDARTANPPTGDSSDPGLYTALAAVSLGSLAALGCVYCLSRKRKKRGA